MRKIREIILHCSDSNIKNHNDISVIRKWHLERGFNDVGYHFFIKSCGQIQNGRDLDIIGAHCKGHNEQSIGICLHGKFAGDFTREQKTSLYHLIKGLTLIFPDVTIHGHNEFSDKKCPVFDVEPFKYI